MNDYWVIPVSYCIGLFPSAYIAGRILKGIDIKKVGDKNPGSANVYRNISHLAGILVLVVDVSKGFLVIFLARNFASQLVVFLSGLAVVLGHNLPVVFKFKGGRGLATTIGVFYALMPIPTGIVSPLGIFMLWKTHHLIIACVVTLIPLFILALVTRVPFEIILYCLGLMCLAGVMHLVTTRKLSKQQQEESIRWY